MEKDGEDKVGGGCRGLEKLRIEKNGEVLTWWPWTSTICSADGDDFRRNLLIGLSDWFRSSATQLR